MRKQKILHLITELEIGGAEIQLLKLLKHLDRQNLWIGVAYIHGNGTLTEEFEKLGIPVFDLTTKDKFSWKSALKLIKLLKQEKIDILHTHLVHASLLGRVSGLLSGAKTIISTRHFGYDPKENSLIYRLERYTAGLDRVIVAVSRYAKNHLLQFNPGLANKVQVIPNGTEVQEFGGVVTGYLKPAESLKIVSVGRLRRIKGYDILIKALSFLDGTLGRVKTYIIGEGPERPELEKLISTLQLDNKVVLLGQVTNEDTKRIVRDCDIYVQPSRWESFGISVLEAMSYGKPVIASRVGGLPEVIEDEVTGFLVYPEDPVALAQAIAKLAKDQSLQHRLGQNSRKKAEKDFRIEDIARKVEMLYLSQNRNKKNNLEKSAGKLKVFQVVTRLNIGGVAKHVIALCSSLDRTKFDVTLVTGQESQLEGSMLDSALKKGIRVIKIPELQRELRPFKDTIAFWKLLHLVSQYKPDIVHTHTSKAGFLGRLAAKLAGVRITIHTFHGHIFEGYFSRSKTKLFLLLERLWALYTNRILAVNRLIFRDLKSLGIGNGKCEVIENGIELENYIKTGRFEGFFRHELGLTPNHVLIGAVGRLVPVKGCTYLLEATAHLLSSMPEARLVLVGDGELRAELKAQAKTLGIDSQVLFTGFRENMEKVYSDLNLLVLSSLNEGLPTVLIEALCAGVPVVATKVGAIPDLMDDSKGMVIEPKDAKALASAMQQMLRNRFRSLTIEIRQEYYERFDLKRFIKDIEKLYFELSPHYS